MTKDLVSLQTNFLEKLQKTGRSRNTIKNYKTDLDCFNNYLKKNQKHLDITGFDIPQIKLYGAFLEKKYSSDNSRRRRVQALRIFFDYLVEIGMFPNNPVRNLPSSPKFLDIPRPTPFIDIKTLWIHLLEEMKSTNDMNKLLAERNQIITLLIFGSGLKVSDISKLRKDQVFADENPRVLITNTKRDPYTIPLPKIFTWIYRNYLEHFEKMKKISKVDFDEVLFNANPYKILSGGISPRGLEMIFEDFRKKLMLNMMTPKSLRQACIFKWIQQRKKESLIKEWMGVAPSYSLKLYKDHSPQHVYSEEFLSELYHHYDAKKFQKN